MTRWDVVVVGAGPAGVLATERLRAGGLRVLLLDAGPRAARGAVTAEDDPRWRFECKGGRAEWVRAHGVGGRSLLWGGWASRFPDAVFREGGWPYGLAEIAPCYAAAERWLGVVQGRLDPRYRRAARALGLTVLPRRSALVGRATWTARHPRAARTARACTTAVSLALGPRGDAEAVCVVDAAGARRELPARAVVLAASPIETARLLLASGVRHPALGRRLVDHTLCSHVLIEPPGARPPRGGRGAFPGSAFVPRYVNLDAASARPYAGGFAIEMVGPWPLCTMPAAMREALGVPLRRGARFTYITGQGELAPHVDRYVDLAPRARDALGRAVPRVHLAYSAAERALCAEMAEACVRVADAIAAPGAELIRYRDPLRPALVFHPAGTCAMGATDDFVCDPRGRVRGARNVWVADASVFPSAGDRHPTLTVLAHALRMTEALAGALRQGT